MSTIEAGDHLPLGSTGGAGGAVTENITRMDTLTIPYPEKQDIELEWDGVFICTR
jgi:hypothetical protein